MRTSLLACTFMACMLAACSPAGSHTASPAASSAASPAGAAAAAPAAPAVPAVPVNAPAQAANSERCPYLDTQWLADTNGQRVTKQGTDPRFEVPACIFWSYPTEPQATIIVRHLPTVEDARAAVDWAAPIAQTEPVSNHGWEGGRGVLGPELSVYAVQKGSTAVLVWTNQAQTFKAELIAQETIKNLRLN